MKFKIDESLALKVLGIALVLIVGIAMWVWSDYTHTRELAVKYGRVPKDADRICEVTITTHEGAALLIPRLNRLPHLLSLATSEVDLNEHQLEAIGDLQTLTRLDIRNGQLEDRDLKHLTRLTNVTDLHLHKNPIDGSGLKHLAGLEKLQLLDLANTKVTGPGIEHLSRLPNLWQLRLGNTPIDDAGMAYVARLPHLRRISFGNTDISEEGFMKLVDCLWLVQVGFPDDMVGPDDDLPARRKAKRAAMIRFREARLEALEKARQAGENVPPDSHVPFRHVTPDSFLGGP